MINEYFILLPIGPAQWKTVFPDANGNHQSPINIVQKKTKYDEELPKAPLKIQYNSESFFQLQNTGFGFIVSPHPDKPEVSIVLFLNLLFLVSFISFVLDFKIDGQIKFPSAYEAHR